MKSKITRRRALATIGAGAAATAAGGAALSYAPDHPDAELLALEQEFSRLREWLHALPEPVSREDEEHHDPHWDRLFALDNQMAETPAHGLDGVAVKLRRLADPSLGIEAGLSNGHPIALRTALEAIEQLAKGGLS